MADSQSSGVPAQVHGDHTHGNSVAAWTSVSVVMFGALIMAVAVLLGSVAVFVVGALVVVAGGVAGKVLSAMGYGDAGSRPGSEAG